MNASSLAFATIEELAPLLAKKKISPVELATNYLSRIERLNPQLNAFLTVTAEQALAEARLAERELLRGQRRGPLHGIPIALKDNIWTRGIRTTAGSAILGNFVPSEDATVVRRLKKAGAVLLGKTNLHEFAYGATNENPHFGFDAQPVGDVRADNWRLERRVGRGGVCRVMRRGARVGHGRLDSPSGCVLRHRGAEANLRAGQREWGRSAGGDI